MCRVFSTPGIAHSCAGCFQHPDLRTAQREFIRYQILKYSSTDDPKTPLIERNSTDYNPQEIPYEYCRHANIGSIQILEGSLGRSGTL